MPPARSIAELALPLADIESEGSRRNFLTRVTGVTPDLVDGWLDGEKRRFYFWHGTDVLTATGKPCGSFVLYTHPPGHVPEGPVLRPADDLREVGPTVYTLAPLPPKPRGLRDFTPYELPYRAVTPSGRRKALAAIDKIDPERLEAKVYDMWRLPVDVREELMDRICAVLH